MRPHPTARVEIQGITAVAVTARRCCQVRYGPVLQGELSGWDANYFRALCSLCGAGPSFIECEDHGVSNPPVLIRLVPRRREAPLEGQGTLRQDKIANRSGKVAREVFDWAEGVIFERRK